MIKKTLILLTVIACMTVATANAGWLYLVPDYNWFGYRDRNGVLHVWRTGKGSLQLSLPFSVSREPCAENLLLRSSIKGNGAGFGKEDELGAPMAESRSRGRTLQSIV